jgi:hypothetical protein
LTISALCSAQLTSLEAYRILAARTLNALRLDLAKKRWHLASVLLLFFLG